MLCWGLLGLVFWEGGFARWGFPWFVGWDLLGWLDRCSLLDSVSLLGFARKASLGKVCWVRLAWSRFLGQVYWVRFSRSCFLSQVFCVRFDGLNFTGLVG